MGPNGSGKSTLANILSGKSGYEISGEIKYKGTFYRAQSPNIIEQGKQVKVISKGDKQETFFIVEEINKGEMICYHF